MAFSQCKIPRGFYPRENDCPQKGGRRGLNFFKFLSPTGGVRASRCVHTGPYRRSRCPGSSAMCLRPRAAVESDRLLIFCPALLPFYHLEQGARNPGAGSWLSVCPVRGSIRLENATVYVDGCSPLPPRRIRAAFCGRRPSRLSERREAPSFRLACSAFRAAPILRLDDPMPSQGCELSGRF